MKCDVCGKEMSVERLKHIHIEFWEYQLCKDLDLVVCPEDFDTVSKLIVKSTLQAKENKENVE